MASEISIKVDGLKEFKAALRSYQKLIEKDVDQSIAKAAQEIVTGAKARCTIPSIAAGISLQRAKNMYTVTTSGRESAYLEFGTGNFAKALLGPYPKDWVDMARTFFVNGLGRTAAQPYLFPAYQQSAGKVITEIIDKIEGH